jgi:hypothetical protein
MSDDIMNELAVSMRERRASERLDVLKALEGHQRDIARLREDAMLIEQARDRLLFEYVVRRKSMRDEEGLKIFRNQLPEELREKMDKAVEMYEAIHGKPPSV